jgi:hypothetical protein
MKPQFRHTVLVRIFGEEPHDLLVFSANVTTRDTSIKGEWLANICDRLLPQRRQTTVPSSILNENAVHPTLGDIDGSRLQGQHSS